MTPSEATGTPSASPNLPELKRLNMWVQEQDRLEPGARTWDQNEWVTLREETPMCQSAYCVCGMAIIRAGHSFVVIDDDRLKLDGRTPSYYDIHELGATLLGLGTIDATNLFEVGNSAADINQMIRGFFADVDADYEATEPAPNFEIEIKAAEAVRPQLLNPINA